MQDSTEKILTAQMDKSIENAGAPVKCKLRFSGLILYGRSIRKVNGHQYDLTIDDETLVKQEDLAALKKQEPNLHIIAK